MELTTGAILRRITETDLSVSAHKLATIILDGIAWKDGYNGLERGTAAFTLAHLTQKMGVSARDILRERGTKAVELGLTDPSTSDEAIIAAMIMDPILVNRPIVSTPKGAALCRPAELVLGLL